MTRSNAASSTRETQMTRFPALFVLAALTVAANAPKAPVRNVVLVHGAWADGSSWAKVIPILEKAASTSSRSRIR